MCWVVMGQRLYAGRRSVRKDDMPTYVRCGQEHSLGEWSSLGPRWLAFRSSWLLSRGQIDFAPAILAVWCHSNPIMFFLHLASAGWFAWTSSGMLWRTARSCSKHCWIWVRETCCLPSSPVLNLPLRLGQAAWQSCLVSRLLSWLPKNPTYSTAVGTAGLRAEPPRTSPGWGFIVKDDMLPDRSFNMRRVKDSGECKSVECYLLCFDRSGLAAVVVVDGALLDARGTRVTHASVCAA